MHRIIDWYFRDTEHLDNMMERCRQLRNTFLLKTMGAAVHRPAVAAGVVYAATKISILNLKFYYGSLSNIKASITYRRRCKFLKRGSKPLYRRVDFTNGRWECGREFDHYHYHWITKRKYLTQKDLAKAAGVGEITVRKYASLVVKAWLEKQEVG